MKKIENYEEIKASNGEYLNPEVGGYVCVITAVKDVPKDENTGKGDYLQIEYDFDEGDFEGYYTDLFRSKGFWGAKFIRSYKEKALGMFKHFIDVVSECNKGFAWDWNETKLVGKRFGAVLAKEEYQKNDGSIGERLYIKDIKTVEQIHKGEFKIPATKKIIGATTSNQNQPVFVSTDNDEAVPF